MAKAIDSAIKKNRYMPQNEYRVTAASGHLLTLQPPEEYDPKYSKWKLEDLPIAFRNWKRVPKTDTERTNGMIKKKLETIKEGLQWCDSVIHAGDPDDEGQLIVDELLDYFQNTKPVMRLDVNDSTEQYIIKMLRKMKDNGTQKNIGRSAYARSVADAMFGFNFSRYYTVSYKSSTPLSIGRVQTPTLGLVVNRDRAIENHTDESYYILSVTATTDDGKSFPMTFEFDKSDPAMADGKVTDLHVFDSIINGINGRRLSASVIKKDIKDSPPLPFNLVELQSYCNKIYGLSPSEVHAVSQSLRNKYNAITYNRSSCQYLHESHHAEAPALMKDVFSNLKLSDPGIDYKIKSKCFNDTYLQNEPHHAIIPTQISLDISKMTEDERKVYKAVCDYYIIQFLPDRKKKQTSVCIDGKNGKNRLIASASVTTEGGYYAYLHNGKTDDKPSCITDFPEGIIYVTISEPNVEEKKTKPPARYNQATLIKDMTCIAKYVSDPEVKQLLISKDSDKQKENGSIGTPATRDQIVATLIARGYLEETGKGKSQHLVSTELGRSFYDILPDNMKCADVTAEWWQITENIKNGEASGDALFDRLLSQINAFLASPPPLHPINGMRAGTDEKVLGKCPVCSSDVVFGEHGAYCKGKCGMYLSGLLGKKLSEKEVTSLLKMKPTSVKGLKSQGGKTYDAVIIPTGTEPFHMLLKDGTEKNGYRFTFEFADKEPVGKCPKCQGNIMNGKYGLYCENKCGYIIPNFLYGKKITVKQYKELLSGNKVLLEGIKSKRSGKEFDAFVSFAGVESFAYIKDGTDVTAYRSKTNIEFR